MNSFRIHDSTRQAVGCDGDGLARGFGIAMKWLLIGFGTVFCSMSHGQSAAPTESFSCPSSTSAQKQVAPAAIAGLYRMRSDWADKDVVPGLAGSRIFNYLAITPIKDNLVRVQLSTIERNGHDCHVDTYASICGSRIVIRPSKEELDVLNARQLVAPELLVGPKIIAFVKNPDGGSTWGAPYCGTMGYLRQEFPRSSRKTSFDSSVFQ